MSVIKDLVRELNTALTATEIKGSREVYWGLQAQLTALRDGPKKSLSIKATSHRQLMAQIATVITLNSDMLYEAIHTLTLTSLMAGVAQSRFSIPVTQSIDIDWRLVNEDAKAFATTYAFDLVKDINQTTVKGLSAAITKFTEGGGLISDLADTIRPLLKDEASTARIEALFHVDRAEMISVTEVTRAYAEGKVNGYMASGLATRRPTAIPPAHPRCRCDVRPEEKSDGSWVWLWLTANDDIVCPICQPYMIKPEVGIARNAPKPEKAIDILYTAEYRLAHSPTFEAVVYPVSGGVIEAKALGTAVYITDEAALSGGLMLYNQVYNPFKFISGPRWDDLAFMHQSGLRELRLIGRDFTGAPLRHVLVAEPEFHNLKPAQLRQLYDGQLAQVGEAHRQRILAGKTAVSRANQTLPHDVFTAVGESLAHCLTYTREVF